MKKVGILTFHRAYNFGAQVQSYALISYLQRKYPDVMFEIIDYQSKSEVRYYISSIIRNALKVGIPAAREEMTRNKRFKEFSNSLPLSDFRIITDSSEKLFKKIDGKYYAIIVGSDAIFNWRLRKFPVPFYLGEDLHCLKISYAASAHALKWKEAEKKEIEYCGKALSDFSYLGVRDKNTEEFVRFCTPESMIYHNCDPSLLLDMKDIFYPNIKNKLIKAGIDQNKPLILVMTADESIVRPIYEKYKTQCEFASLYLTNPVIKTIISDLTPLEWAGIFKFAKITITEYFHGTLLSLKNSTPVISIDRTDVSTGYEGKIRDVLAKRMGLEEMYFQYKDAGTEEFINRANNIVEKAMEDKYTNEIQDAINEEAKNINSFDAFFEKVLSDGCNEEQEI